MIGSFPIAWVAGAEYDFYEDLIWPRLWNGGVDNLASQRMRFDDDGFHDGQVDEAGRCANTAWKNEKRRLGSF